MNVLIDSGDVHLASLRFKLNLDFKPFFRVTFVLLSNRPMHEMMEGLVLCPSTCCKGASMSERILATPSPNSDMGCGLQSSSSPGSLGIRYCARDSQ